MIFRELPAGLELCELANHCDELARSRLSAVAQLLADGEKARAAAVKAGAYELDSGLALMLGREGITLGTAGEFPALSPCRWPGLPAGEPFAAFRARLAKEKKELRGIVLSEKEEAALCAFLSVNKSPLPTEAWKLVEICHHFFFRDSLKVAVSYTQPRFAQN